MIEKLEYLGYALGSLLFIYFLVFFSVKAFYDARIAAARSMYRSMHSLQKEFPDEEAKRKKE